MGRTRVAFGQKAVVLQSIVDGVPNNGIHATRCKDARA